MQFKQKHIHYLGIMAMLISSLGFSLMSASAKILKPHFNAGQLVFYRNAIGLIFLLLTFLHHPYVKKQGGRLFWLIFRGVVGTLALYMLMYSVLHMPLGTAMTYSLTSAIFVSFFSYVLFKEKLGLYIWLAVCIGFVGILLIFKPGFNVRWLYHIIGIGSGVGAAMAYITIGKISTSYESRAIVLSFMLSGVLFPLVLDIIGRVFNIPEDPVMFIRLQLPQGRDWFFIWSLGLSAFIGQYFLTKAYSIEKAAVVSSVSFIGILFSVVLGTLLGDKFPDIFSVLGMLLIISGGVLIAFYKRDEVRKVASPTPPMEGVKKN